MKRHHLRMGDKSSAGGVVIEGIPTCKHSGISLTFLGAQVDCPACKTIGHIVAQGPRLSETMMGKAAALENDICLCECDPPPVLQASHNTRAQCFGMYQLAEMGYAADGTALTKNVLKRHGVADEWARPSLDLSAEPGFYIVPRKIALSQLEPLLLGAASPKSRALFRQLNASSPVLRAGQIVLLADPHNTNQTHAVRALQKAKAKIDDVYRQLDPPEASFLARHYATIANFSSIADKGVGLAGDSVKIYFEQLEEVLRKIHDAYRNTYQASGKLASEAFYAERRKLFSELDGILPNFIKKNIGLEDYPDIKKALNLSTRSIVHHWEDVGVGEIPGYATYVGNAGQYVKWMSRFGYVAIGFSALHSGNEIYHACTTGRESECKQTTFKETGGFSLGLVGGLAGHAAGMTICSIGLGALTAEAGGAGALLCSVILGGAGSYAGSEYLGKFGENAGNFIYGIAS